MVNEASLALRKVIINMNNKTNPLKEWGNAAWFYKWIKVDEENAHCICLAFVPVSKDSIEFYKPDKFQWRSIDNEI